MSVRKWLQHERAQLRRRERYLKLVESLLQRFPDLRINSPQEGSFSSNLVTPYANDFTISTVNGKFLACIGYTRKRWEKTAKGYVDVVCVARRKPFALGEFNDLFEFHECPSWEAKMHNNGVPPQLITRIREQLDHPI